MSGGQVPVCVRWLQVQVGDTEEVFRGAVTLPCSCCPQNPQNPHAWKQLTVPPFLHHVRTTHTAPTPTPLLRGGSRLPPLHHTPAPFTASRPAGLPGLISGLDSALSRANANRSPAGMPVLWAPAPAGGGVGNPAKASQEAERWLTKAADEAKAKYGAKPDVVLVVLPSRPAPGGMQGPDAEERQSSGKAGP